MRYPQEVRQLRNSPQYIVAEDLLETILLKEDPTFHIKELYGNNGFIKENIVTFYETTYLDPSMIRRNNDNAPTEISDMRMHIQQDPAFSAIHSALIRYKQWELPDRQDMKIFFGPYTDSVYEIYKIFQDAKKQRKCGIPATAHLNRVAGTVYALLTVNPAEDPDHDFIYKYTAAAAIHDVIEDMLQLHGGIEKYNLFVDRYIPKSLQPIVIALTNHYDTLLKNIDQNLKRHKTFMTKETLLEELSKMHTLRNSYAFDNLEQYIENISKKAEKLRSYKNIVVYNGNGEGKIASTKGTDIFETISWICYKDLFIPEIIDTNDVNNNYMIPEIKAVDRSDNGHGLKDLNIDSKTKNLNKQAVFVNEGLRLNTSWQPFNNHLLEIMEDTLVYSKFLIISDLLNAEESAQDFIAAALTKIHEQRHVLYHDRTV